MQRQQRQQQQKAKRQAATYGDLMEFLAEFPAINAQKVGIARHRPPLRLRMVEQFGQRHAAQFAGFAVVRSRVVDHRGLGARLRHNHRVPRRRLPELPVEEQIARQRLPHIAAHKVCIALHQRLGVRKLRKRAVAHVRRLKRPRPHAEERRAQRRVRDSSTRESRPAAPPPPSRSSRTSSRRGASALRGRRSAAGWRSR